MTHLDLYEHCRKISFRKGQGLWDQGVDPEDLAHDIYLTMVRRGDEKKDLKLVKHKIRLEFVDGMRRIFGRKDRKPRPKFIYGLMDPDFQSSSPRLQYTEDLDQAMEVEELREMDGGRYSALIHAMICSEFEQKVAADILGVSRPAVSQGMSRLRKKALACA